MSIDVRLAAPDDRLKLIELQRRASLAGNEPEVVRQLLERPEIIDLDEEMLANNEVFVAERGKAVVGFATIVAHEGADAELEGIFVEPAAWRTGVGTALLHAIEREARAWGASRLHVTANRNALGFYLASGFTAVGETRTALGPMAVLMVKAVPGGS
jgi:GNAT superfamily N-acetyltransferase